MAALICGGGSGVTFAAFVAVICRWRLRRYLCNLRGSYLRWRLRRYLCNLRGSYLRWRCGVTFATFVAVICGGGCGVVFAATTPPLIS